MTGEVPTIFALSSGQDRAGVSIVRLSGPRAQAALLALVPRIVPTPRLATRVRLVDPTDGGVLDDALALWFPAPKSFTGEDVVELHVHGGRAVVAGVLAALGRMAGLRLAEPGEFTRRAFEHGKIDLTEAEGLADLIEAETEAQRRLALRQLSGALHGAAEGWRADLLKAQALVEAAIDFSDESDVSQQAVDDAVDEVEQVSVALRAALDDGHRGEILRDGFRVVIAGPPNVGKSSLINALARREAAIVSAEAGTTRDIVELQLNLGGLAVVLADTAGVRPASGEVEREGIRRGLARAQQADLVLWVVDAAAPDLNLPPELHRLGERGFLGSVLQVWNKGDLLLVGPVGDDKLVVSTLTGAGLGLLEAGILDLARARTHGGEAALITTARHRQQIAAAECATQSFLRGAKSDLELRAEDLRLASQAIGRLVGRVDAEEILGAIFGRFCIGK
jgi:tRNA modification GTPase